MCAYRVHRGIRCSVASILSVVKLTYCLRDIQIFFPTLIIVSYLSLALPLQVR